MPINIIGAMVLDGPDVFPGWKYIKNYGPAVAAIGALKYYFGGSYNEWERDMHSRVFIITGATSGVGAQVAFQLASMGAQIIILVRSTEDQWTIDFVEDLRDKTDNFLIYAEECDLADLYSVRKFATKWLDNKPPRRLDGVICCAAETLPMGVKRQITKDGVERQIGINYLGHQHLLNLLSPALRMQPPDRDVRVVVATCASQSLGEIDENDLLWEERKYPSNKPWKVFGTSKLYLSIFIKKFQRQIDTYERKDKTPCNVRCITVNPGLLRTPSTRRFLSMGSIFGLIIYWILFPFWFIFLKSAYQGSQSIMYALCSKEFASMEGGQHVHECKIIRSSRKELEDEDLQDRLYDATVAKLEKIELQSAKERAIHRKTNKESTGKKKSSIEEEIYTVPKTPEDLQSKLDILRESLATKQPQNSNMHNRKQQAGKKSRTKK